MPPVLDEELELPYGTAITVVGLYVIKRMDKLKQPDVRPMARASGDAPNNKILKAVTEWQLVLPHSHYFYLLSGLVGSKECPHIHTNCTVMLSAFSEPPGSFCWDYNNAAAACSHQMLLLALQHPSIFTLKILSTST